MKISIEENNFPVGSEVVLKNSPLNYIYVLIIAFAVYQKLSFLYTHYLVEERVLGTQYFIVFPVMILGILYFLFNTVATQSVFIDREHVILSRTLWGVGRKNRIELKDIKYIYFQERELRNGFNAFNIAGKFKNYFIVFQTEEKDYTFPMNLSQHKCEEHAEKLSKAILGK